MIQNLMELIERHNQHVYKQRVLIRNKSLSGDNVPQLSGQYNNIVGTSPNPIDIEAKLIG